jgi:hypothetical protein
MAEREKMAFQCRNCGAVAPAGAAGDNDLPHACHICRHGIKYIVSEDGTHVDKQHDPKNWIVLADLSPEELAKDFHRHGLKAKDVVKHKGVKPVNLTVFRGKHVAVEAQENVGAKIKAEANKS